MLICLLVGQNIRSFSRHKHYRGANRLDNEIDLRGQNSRFALFCCFTSVLRLFKYIDPIVEYDEGEDRNLFDFREPRKVLMNQRIPLISE